MAVIHVASATPNEANPTTGFTFTVPTVVAGDDMKVAVMSAGHSSVDAYPTVTDNDGGTWVKIAEGGDSNRRQTLWERTAGAATTGKTITVAGCINSAAGVLDINRDVLSTSTVSEVGLATGVETRAGITPPEADSMIVCIVFNHQQPFAVTGMGCTDPGALTSRAEHLSTGGGDCAVSLWSAPQSGGPTATGDFTWSQSDAATRTMAYALAPAAAGEDPGSAPAFQADGSATGSAGAVSPVWPAHEAGDIGLMFVETANQAVATVPTGWAHAPDSPQGTGTAGGAAATMLSVLWKRAESDSEPALSIGDSGNHQVAQILTVRGCIETGSPFDVTAGDAQASADTSVEIPGLTTTAANRLVVAAVSWATWLAGGQIVDDEFANADLTGLTKRFNTNLSDGNGGGFGVATGTKAATGAVEPTTATMHTSSAQARWSGALKPAAAAGAATVNAGVGLLTWTGFAPTVLTGVTAPRVQAGGQIIAAVGAAQVPWPAHMTGDVALLIVETRDEFVELADAQGFVEVDQRGASGPEADTTSTRAAMFQCRATSGAMGAPTVADPGNHLTARILTFRGCVATGNPIHTTLSDAETTATAVLIPAPDTTVPGCLIVGVVTWATDTTDDQIVDGEVTNADLTDVTLVMDDSRIAGDGGGFAVVTGVKAVPGVTGDFAATLATASRQAMLTIALLPADASDDGDGDPTVGHRYWRLALANTPGPGPHVNEVELVERDAVAGATGSSFQNPAALHPGVTHFRPVIVANWENTNFPDGEFDVDFMYCSLSAGDVPTIPGDEARRELDTLFDSDGVLLPTVRQDGLPLVKGEIFGSASHGQEILYADQARTFQTTPLTDITGGITNDTRAVWGTAAEVDAGSGNTDALLSTRAVEQDYAMLDAFEGGGIIRARLVQRSGVVTPHTLGFAGDNMTEIDDINIVATLTGATTEVTTYTVSVRSECELRSTNGQPYSVALHYSVQTTFNGGASWQTRSDAVLTYDTTNPLFNTQTAELVRHILAVGFSSPIDDGDDQIRIILTNIVEQGLGEYVTANTWVNGSSVGFVVPTGNQYANAGEVKWRSRGYL